MPPINIIPLAGLADQPHRQTPEGRPPQTITGKVYALKDGSGYVALASDGRYYRVDAGIGHGLTFSRTGGFVEAAMVDVVRGPVSTVEARSDKRPGATNADEAGADPARSSRDAPVELHLPGSREPADGKHRPGDPAPLEDAGQATASSRATHAMIVQQPDAALDSQANLPARNALSLLDRTEHPRHPQATRSKPLG